MNASSPPADSDDAAARPEADRPEAAGPEAAGPEAALPETARPEAAGPEKPSGGADRASDDRAGYRAADGTATEADDEQFEAELNDRVTAHQRAWLHQLTVDAARLFRDGGGFALANSAVQNSGFNVHLGDVIVGGRATASTSVLATGPIDATFLTRASVTFVRPDCFAALYTIVNEQRIAVVVAPRGSGATTLALQLLRETSGAVRKLDPDHDVRRIDLSKLAKDTGYLMEAPPLDLLAQWRDVHLEVLAGQLESRGMRLIITTSSTGRELEAALGPFVVRADRPPAQRVLEAHMKNLLDGAPANTLDELLATVRDEGLLTELAMVRIDHAVQLAAALAQVPAGTATIADIRARLDGHTAERFADWFASQDTVDQQALVISLAVLHDLPWEWVTDRAKEVAATALDGATAEPEESAKPSRLLTNGQSKRLELARAELVSTAQETAYGRLTVTTARFRDDGWPFRVLDLVWREYDDARDWLLDWLRGFADSPRLPERVRAAAVVGLFACYSLERVHRDVLLPWADSDRQSTRLMAATALAVAGSEQDLSPLVGRLLQDWSRDDQRPNRRWTAARAMGLGLGLVSPGRAFKVLATAGTAVDGQPHPAIARAVAQSLIEMFVEGDAGLRSRLLARLVDWTDRARSRELLRTGHQSFLRIAIDVQIDSAGRGDVWPALLWLASTDPAEAAKITLLWRRALWSPKIGQAARGVLRHWLRRAVDHHDLRRPLADLLPELSGSDRERGQLRYHLRRWRVTDPDLIPVIDDILAQLDPLPNDGAQYDREGGHDN